ncbi:hypothetical protein ABLG96_15555 [Nakamurella sp. A5-74]|uniref:Uncharacterized protein n=1 Tax=Nakamurella sp. A5-74 TaxID=3158264 RepID=A0AAU8DN39_9ACTN
MTTTPAPSEALQHGADDQGSSATDRKSAPGSLAAATATPPPRGKRAGLVDYLLWCAPPLVLTLMTMGFFPGFSPSQLSWMLGAGHIQCLSNMGFGQFSSYCQQIGAPVGSPLLTGLVQTYLGSLLHTIPFIDPWAAYQIVGVLTVAGSYAGGVAVLRRFGAPIWLASLGVFIFLTSPTVLLLNGYNYTFHGFIMLPAATWAALASFENFRRGRNLRGALPAFLTPWLLVFTDGYSFVTAMVLIVGVGIGWLFGDAPKRAKVWGTASWVAGVGTAALAYLSYIPAGSTHPHTGLGSFRFYGADFITFLIPPPVNYWAAEMPWKNTLQQLWGTSDNQFSQYPGYVALALFVVLIASGALRRLAPGRGELIALAAVGVFCAILSLGPSFKLANRQSGVLGQDNLPAELTRFTLPTSFLYENVPGFQDMRATYRSFVGTRWVLIVLAVVALVMLLRTRAKVLVPFLAILLLLDSMPNFAKQIALRASANVQLDAARTGSGGNLAKLINPGDKALILPASNDFLAAAFVPFTGGTSYNNGQDKNLEYSRDNWPQSVRDAVSSYGSPEFVDKACTLLHSDASVIVLSYMGLLNAAVDSATIPQPEPVLTKRAQAVAATGKFAVTETGTAIAIRIPADRDCR